jgi:hypothetical protein
MGAFPSRSVSNRPQTLQHSFNFLPSKPECGLIGSLNGKALALTCSAALQGCPRAVMAGLKACTTSSARRQGKCLPGLGGTNPGPLPRLEGTAYAAGGAHGRPEARHGPDLPALRAAIVHEGTVATDRHGGPGSAERAGERDWIGREAHVDRSSRTLPFCCALNH